MNLKLKCLTDLKEYNPEQDFYDPRHVKEFWGWIHTLMGFDYIIEPLDPKGTRWWVTEIWVLRDKVEAFCCVMENFSFVQVEVC